MATTTITPGNDVYEALGLSDLANALAGIFEIMEWAEDEIEKATRRHPRHRDVLWHSFSLIRPRDTDSRLGTEMVYRSHAAELLERVVTGADTRPPTAAEMCVVCLEASKAVPMHGDSAGLYFRVWAKAFPDNVLTTEQTDTHEHYEQLFGSRIDILEQDVARKITDQGRILGEIDCHGYHHGEPVTCRFAQPEDARRDAARAARPGKLAAKFAAETVHAEPAQYREPTDEAFVETFANCGRIPPATMYPAIREAFLAGYADDIAALTAPPVESEQPGTCIQLDLWGPVLAEMAVA